MRALRRLLAIGGMIAGLVVFGTRACASPAAASRWSITVQIAVSESPAESPEQ